MTGKEVATIVWTRTRVSPCCSQTYYNYPHHSLLPVRSHTSTQEQDHPHSFPALTWKGSRADISKCCPRVLCDHRQVTMYLALRTEGQKKKRGQGEVWYLTHTPTLLPSLRRSLHQEEKGSCRRDYGCAQACLSS